MIPMSGADSTSARSLRRGYEVKATAFRNYIAVIEKLGVMAQVLSRVLPETRQLIESPPLPATWMDAGPIEDMISALVAVRGVDVVRSVTRAGQEAAGLVILRPILSGLLRLFGGTPHTLFSRYGELTKTALRGVGFEWVNETPRSGRLTVIFPMGNMPRHAFVGMESGCELALEFCKVPGGVVSPSEISADGARGVIRIRW
jgi:hypothetical protein